MSICSKLKRAKRQSGRRGLERSIGSIQKWLDKTVIEFHWPGYQYMGPGTYLAKPLKRGDPGTNWLDNFAKQHDIDYSHAKNLQDKWKADAKVIEAIDRLPVSQTGFTHFTVMVMPRHGNSHLSMHLSVK